MTNETGGTRKFFFDLNDFSSEALAAAKKAKENAPPTYTQDQLDLAVGEATAHGRTTGHADAMQSLEKQTLDTLNALAQAADRLYKAEESRTARMIDQASTLAFQAISVVLPQLLELHGADHIIAFIKSAVRDNMKVGKLTISVHPEQRDIITGRLEDMGSAFPWLQDLEIKAEHGLGLHECRVGWTQGGAEWNPDRIASEILSAFRSHLVETSETTHTVAE